MTLMRSLIATSRPLSWINTAYPFAAAYLLVGGAIDWTLILGTIFFLVPYNLAMYGINDVFDYESDLVNPRKGGVEGALVPRRMHEWILVACVLTTIPFLAYLWVVGTLASGIGLAVVMFAVVAYSLQGLRFKEKPFLDSLTSSTHFVGPAVVGALMPAGSLGTGTLVTLPIGAAGDPSAVEGLPWAVWLALAAFFSWGMASHAFGAVQDIRSDREAGLGSIGTVMGAATTTRVAIVLYALAGVLLLVPWNFSSFAALLVVPYIVSIWPYRSLSDADCEIANAGWKRFLWLNYVVGFLVTMLIIAALLVA